MVLLSQCDFRSDRGLELHFSEEQRPVGAGIAETLQTREENRGILDAAMSWITVVLLGK